MERAMGKGRRAAFLGLLFFRKFLSLVCAAEGVRDSAAGSPRNVPLWVAAKMRGTQAPDAVVESSMLMMMMMMRCRGLGTLWL